MGSYPQQDDVCVFNTKLGAVSGIVNWKPDPDDNESRIAEIIPGYNIEVMQYTGLTDKNEVEIWEGDIVVARYTGGERVGEIFSQQVVKWGVYNLGANNFDCYYSVVGPYVESEYLYGEMIEGIVEVIGNIYQDSHLLDR